MTHDIAYIVKLHDCGFSWEFIAKDCNITIESLMRRLARNGIEVKS